MYIIVCLYIYITRIYTYIHIYVYAHTYTHTYIYIAIIAIYIKFDTNNVGIKTLTWVYKVDQHKINKIENLPRNIKELLKYL